VILRSLPIGELAGPDRLWFVELPWAYREDRYLRSYRPCRAVLTAEIGDAEYLLFSPTAKYDWATLAADVAWRMHRPFDIECDVDLDSVSRRQIEQLSFGPQRLRKEYWRWSLNRRVRRCLRRSALALLQGREVFEAYSAAAPNPHEVLNVQVDAGDRPSAEAFAAKLDRIASGAPLSIVYSGQMVERKGPLDWVRCVGALVDEGHDVDAVWFGDGPMRSEIEALVEELGLTERIELPGVVDRSVVMDRLRTSDVFLFCHKSAESPRCLGEALAAGCALVGYDSAYPRGLVQREGGAILVRMHDWRALAKEVAALHVDRAALRSLTQAAAASGALLDRDSSMGERIELMRRHLAA
jgi:glycosyltransferase involved in cell wall biosynthesis